MNIKEVKTMDVERDAGLSEDLIVVHFELQLEKDSFSWLCERLRMACSFSLPHAFAATVEDFIEGELGSGE